VGAGKTITQALNNNETQSFLSMILCDYYYRDAHTGKKHFSPATFQLPSTARGFSFQNTGKLRNLYSAHRRRVPMGTAQLIFRKEKTLIFSMQLPPWDVQNPPTAARRWSKIGGKI
jgi:hypothetical protein